MTPHAVLNTLWSHGATVSLAPNGVDLLVPGDTPASLIGLLRDNKTDVLEFLHAAHVTTAEVIDAAMRCCDFHGDGDKARAEMRQQVIDTPDFLKPDLMAHFINTYPPKRKASHD